MSVSLGPPCLTSREDTGAGAWPCHGTEARLPPPKWTAAPRQDALVPGVATTLADGGAQAHDRAVASGEDRQVERVVVGRGWWQRPGLKSGNSLELIRAEHQAARLEPGRDRAPVDRVGEPRVPPPSRQVWRIRDAIRVPEVRSAEAVRVRLGSRGHSIEGYPGPIGRPRPAPMRARQLSGEPSVPSSAADSGSPKAAGVADGPTGGVVGVDAHAPAPIPSAMTATSTREPGTIGSPHAQQGSDDRQAEPLADTPLDLVWQTLPEPPVRAATMTWADARTGRASPGPRQTASRAARRTCLDEWGRDEQELVRRCKEGSEAAYAVLVRLHRPRLYTLAYRLLLDRESAEDVVQETFIAAFRQMERFEPRPSLAAWLNTIALRMATRAAARQRSRPKTSIDAPAFRDNGNGADGFGDHLAPWRPRRHEPRRRPHRRGRGRRPPSRARRRDRRAPIQVPRRGRAPPRHGPRLRGGRARARPAPQHVQEPPPARHEAPPRRAGPRARRTRARRPPARTAAILSEAVDGDRIAETGDIGEIRPVPERVAGR